MLRVDPVSSGGLIAWHPDASFDGELTLEAWVYLLEPQGHLVLNKFEGGAEDIILRLGQGERPSAALYLGSAQLSTPTTEPLSLGEWHHLALVHTAAETLLFADGTVITRQASGLLAPDARAPLTIGGSARAPGFHGYITQVRFSRGARYLAEFRPDRELGVDTSTLGLWRLREGVGSVICDRGPFAMHGSAETLEWEAPPSLP